MNYTDSKSDLLAKWVLFKVGRKKQYGRITSIDHEIAHIRGLEQLGHSQPFYHLHLTDLKVCTHDEVFKLGQSTIPNHTQ